MAHFSPGSGTTAPFGRNEFLRSVRDVKTDSFTLARTSVPAVVIDGVGGQQILQPGTVLARITSAAGTSTAADVGKVGPFQAGALDGRQTIANIVGLCQTFLPWTLMERDVEIAAIYEASVVQAWCLELDAGGLPIVLTNTTRAGLTNLASMDIRFR